MIQQSPFWAYSQRKWDLSLKEILKTEGQIPNKLILQWKKTKELLKEIQNLSLSYEKMFKNTQMKPCIYLMILLKQIEGKACIW